MHDAKKHRKNFAVCCTIIGAAITVVSLAMTYSIFAQCFADWTPAARRFLTIACCVAIEGTSAGLIYGLVYALTGFWERTIAFVGLVGIAAVMGINIVTHAMQVRGMPIQDWQEGYIVWVGPGVLVGVFALIILLVMVRFETRHLKAEREIEYASTSASLTAQQEWIESDDFKVFLEQNKQAYFEKVAQRLGLKPGEVKSFPKAQSRP